MMKRLLITSAGTSAAENLVRSLRAGHSDMAMIGCHHDRFILKKSSCERRCLIPRPDDFRCSDALRRLVDNERIDLVIPTSDMDVGAISDLRDDLPGRSFLPAHQVIQLFEGVVVP